MTPEEVSFYEALRRQALTKLSNLHDQGKGGGQRKIHILAEITRLRRACCHPILVDKDITLGSSKMKVFLELVEELLDNNHQALVFSQYVGYLALVREELDKKGISYQYLDGSTPSAERKKQVEACMYTKVQVAQLLVGPVILAASPSHGSELHWPAG